MIRQILRKIKRYFCINRKNIPILTASKVNSYEDYVRYATEHRQTGIENFSFEKGLIPDIPKKFKYNGYCYVCKTFVNFMVDFNYATQVDGDLMPNWRERLVWEIPPVV